MSPRPPRWTRPITLRAAAARRGGLAAAWTAAAALWLGVAAGGCAWLPGAPADLSLTSQAHPGRGVSGHFDTALYRFDDDNTLTVVLLQGPERAPARAVTIRMFWRPAASRTPITPHATNATFQYIVFSRSTDAHQGASTGVGVYDGAGYFYPDSPPGSASVTGAIWHGDLRLRDASENFHDPLGQATLSGDLTAHRDDQAVLRLLRELSARVSRRLGYPRLVRRAAPAIPTTGG